MNLNRATLIQMLRQEEDVKKFPYTDTKGKITIGVGRNLTDNGLSEVEIGWLLDNDIDRVIKELDSALPWWKGLNGVRQLVLADMCFNLGLPRFLKFKKTLAAAQTGDFDLAASEMLDSSWAKDVGKRAVYLSTLMRTGVMS